ncbi:hypothetical protein [Galactobacter caseinivorans]|uniref:Uncharacterized protein n=1 Tax=Galactobacter caseinivorans TaxID=2676123 RepID=A0A496PG69_9MICC|nr:hypothetical protein [Galactobacter caseinivorans]RKW69525.1 hypothetical protein DWQ67_11990 [Galactobacter caseinivorans]
MARRELILRLAIFVVTSVALAQLDPLDPLAILNDGGYSLNTLQGTLLSKLAWALAIPALLAWLIPRPLRELARAPRPGRPANSQPTEAFSSWSSSPLPLGSP